MYQYANLEWHLTKKDLANAFEVTYRSIERFIKQGILPQPSLVIGSSPRWAIGYLNESILKNPKLAKVKIIHIPIYKGKKQKRGTFTLSLR